MARQQRALRTRMLLIEAAADEFNRQGFHGTSLSQICKTAEISMGALTFHFSSKADLADAIKEAGWSPVRAAVGDVARQQSPPLQRAVTLAVRLTQLMEGDLLVRCAVRLSREWSDGDEWSALWLPVVSSLASEAHECGQLDGDALPDDVSLLIELLVKGSEVALQSSDASAADCDSAVDRLQRSCRLLLKGIAPAE